VAESLLIGVVALAGLVIVVAMNAQSKARAFEHRDADPAGHRPPEAVTSIDLPPPQFNRRDPDRRGK
jgi:hypothetical protein